MSEVMTEKFNRINARFQELYKEQGLTLRVTCGYRSPRDQAILYRKSQTTKKVIEKCNQLSKMGYPELAEILEKIPPQKTGRWLTSAGPGESWHNFDLALDICIFNKEGRRLWGTAKKEDLDRWLIFGKLSVEENLTWGGYFKNKDKNKDYGHIQYHSVSNPLNLYSRRDVIKLLGLQT